MSVLALYVYVQNLIFNTRTCILAHSMFPDSQLTFPKGNVEELHFFYIKKNNKSIYYSVTYSEKDVKVVVFNATFNNISYISWRSVLRVEETGGPG